MIYKEKPPTPALQRHIDAFWRLEAQAPGANSAQEKILPDGRVELIFNLAARFQRFHKNGAIEKQPGAILVGQMREPVSIAPTGAIDLFGIRFKPGGAFPFLRIPLHELTDHILPAAEHWRDFVPELEERLRGAQSFAEKIRHAEAVLWRLFQPQEDRAVETLIDRIMASEGRRSVTQLAHDLGLSARQLERRFQITVGLGPKLLARIIRFQKIFKALEENPHGWSDVALACGYYDQAHLIHDFKGFSGQNPSAFLLAQTQMSAYLTRKHRTSFFYKTKR